MAFSQTIQDFYQNNKQIIKTLIVGGGGATVVTLGTTFFKIIKSVRKQHRSRRIPRNTFALELITPQSKNLKQQIFGGKYDDSLADHNIPYQQRVANRNIRKELQQILEEHRWLLILGRTGIGKTREAVELAERYNNLGWTVFYFKPGEWLDVPARPPKEFGKGRKLLFLLDDLNRRMYRSEDEKNPKAEESLSEPLNVPLQERLLNALEKYENFCGKAEILVIATARNEKESQFKGERSPWEQLQWEKYPKLWQRFTVYDLPEPDDDAIIDVLAATISNTDITPKPEQYPNIASSNDRTFRNVVENLRRLENDNLPLNTNTYRPSLGKTWEKRYQEAVKRYPATKYVYDAVDLLRQFDISLERFIIEPTANLMVEENIWQRLWYRFKISSALNYLLEIERIKNPRDGQIEAKKYQIEASEYASSLTNLFLRVADKYPDKLEDSRMSFGRSLLKIKFYEEALNYFTRLIKIFPQNTDFWNGNGNALLGLKRYEAAITCYDKALEINPLYEKAWSNRGNALKKLKRYEEAIDYYNKALEINPLYESAWNGWGNILLNLRRYEEAIDCYNKALEINPSFEYAWNNLGLALNNLKRYEEAIICYHKVLEINPSYEESVWSNIGNALRNLECYEEAIIHHNKALEINPSFEYAWAGRGNVMINLKRYKEAITCYDKALEFNPSFAAAWNHRGNALKNLKRYEEAIDSYNKALKINPSFESAWNNRGNTLLGLKRYEEAIGCYDKALEINPSFEYAWAGRGNVMRNLKRYEEAISCYDRALKINPSFEPAWNGEGNTLLGLKRYEEAISCYDKALEINPSFEYAWAGRGNVMRNLKRYEEAITYYDKALEINPDFKWALVECGITYREIKHYEDALKYFDRVIEIDPDYAYAITQRGYTYLWMKHYEDALKDFDRAIEIDPDYVWALARRSEYYLMLKPYDSSLRDLNRAVKLEEDNDWNLYLRALTYKALNQLDKAHTDLANAVKLAKPKYEENPQDWQNTLNLAIYYLAADYIPTAKQLYKLVLSQDVLQGYIDMAIHDLDDFLTVFPNHTEAQTMRILLDSK